MYCQSCNQKLPTTIRVCPNCGGKQFVPQPNTKNNGKSKTTTNMFSPSEPNQKNNLMQQPTVPPLPTEQLPLKSASSMEYASFWRRLAAYIIDIIVLMIPIVIISVILNTAEYADLMFAIIYIFYGAILNSSKRQATIGKRALGLWVFDEQGHRLSFGKSFLRSITFCFIGFLSFIMFFTERKQAVQDLVARSVVLHSAE